MNNYRKIILLIIILFVGGCRSEMTNNYKNDDFSSIVNIKVIINNHEYVLMAENNNTVHEFVKLLPQKYIMNELNGNEKYVYMNNNLPTNSISPKNIRRGDVMLYGNNCLVIFYQDFTTNYQYTRIGHIDELPVLNSDSISVEFIK